MGRRDRAIVQTDAGGSPVLVADSLNLRDAEAALVRDAVKHAETLAVAAAMLGLSVAQLRSKARQLRIALHFAAKEASRKTTRGGHAVGEDNAAEVMNAGPEVR